MPAEANAPHGAAVDAAPFVTDDALAANLMPADRMPPEAMRLVAYPRGTVLFRQGEPADAAYVVKTGALCLYRENAGSRVPLATVRRGEMFGELCVLDGSPRRASAVVLEDSVLMVVPGADMSPRLAAADPMLSALADIFAANLRNVHDGYAPKPRSLLDGVNNLSRQYDLVAKFVRGYMPPATRAAFENRLKVLEGLVRDLRGVALANRQQDRRDDAVPHEADLPL